MSASVGGPGGLGQFRPIDFDAISGPTPADATATSPLGQAGAVALGARGANVQAVQRQLQSAGFDLGAGGSDGQFGRATERAIADLQRRCGLTPTGQLDPATAETLSARAAAPRISAAVGPCGRNDPVDVRVVQKRLGDLGFYRGDMDGRYGPRLAKALQLFDGTVRGLSALERGAAAEAEAKTLAPGEETERWLRAKNAPRWERLPRSGEGFKNVDIEGHDYASSWLTDVVKTAGAAYQRDYRSGHPGASEILTNDASWRAGGDTHDHETHETGLDLDISLKRGGTTVGGRGYDREATWAKVQSLLDAPNVADVILNDPEIVRRANADPRYCGRVLTDSAGVHDNHIHVDIRPPRIEE